MFLGQHSFSFEDSNRLTVPTPFRDELGRGAFITQGFDRNLWVLSADAFQAVFARFTVLNIADPLARLLLRMVLGHAVELVIDESGNMVIPQELRDFAGLGKEAVLVGQGRYFEIWAPASWQKQELALQDAEANADRFAGLAIMG
jgi:MraZ protein